HDDRARRLAGLDRRAGLHVGVVVAAGIDGGDVDVGMFRVELLDQTLHLHRQFALHRHRKEQLQFGRGMNRTRHGGGRKRERQGGGGQQTHGYSPHLIPEYVKLATNCRWNSTNSTSSGAATRNVPAATTPHSDPASAPEVNDASPTVSTWVLGEDVAISGHRNSF